MLDGRLANDNQADAEICGFFPSRMRAELDYGQDYAETGGLTRCLEMAELLISNKIPDFEDRISKNQKALSGISIPETKRPYLTEIKAWHELIVRQNYLDAAKAFVECIGLYAKSELEKNVEQRQEAWMNYLTAMCFYLAFLNYKNAEYKTKVIQHLQEAVKRGTTSWFSGLQLLVNELEQTGKKEEELVFNTETQDFKERLLRSWEEFAASNKSKKRTPKTAWEEIRKALAVGKHNEVCDKLKIVFELMGFEVRKRNEEEGEPDLELFTTTGNRYICIVEVKTKEQNANGPVGREDIDQIAGHKPGYLLANAGKPIHALLFTNKEEFSDTAVAKAAGNVRLLRATEFVSFLSTFGELMEKGWKANYPYEKLKAMQLMLMPGDYEEVLKPSETSQVSIEELNALARW
jgi:hypothetical protein